MPLITLDMNFCRGLLPRRPLRALHKAGLFIHFQVLLLCSQIRSLSYGRCLAIKSISPMGFGTRPLWVFLDELNPRIEVVLRKAARRSFALSPSGAYLLRLLASRSFFVRRRAGALPSALAARTFFAFFIVVQVRRLQRGNSKTANSDSKRTSAPKAERTAALQSIQCGFHSELEASVERIAQGPPPPSCMIAVPCGSTSRAGPSISSDGASGNGGDTRRHGHGTSHGNSLGTSH